MKEWKVEESEVSKPDHKVYVLWIDGDCVTAAEHTLKKIADNLNAMAKMKEYLKRLLDESRVRKEEGLHKGYYTCLNCSTTGGHGAGCVLKPVKSLLTNS